MKVLEVNNLSFAYSKTHPVFHNVNFSLEAGEVFTILGPNGVGKSTLLHCLVGLLTPNEGTVMVNGKKLGNLKHKTLAQQVAYVPQDYHINSNLTVLDYLLTGRAPYLSFLQTPHQKDAQLAENYLQRFHLSPFRDHPFISLSGGQQQLITIIRALLQEPRLLRSEEHTSELQSQR